MSQTPNKIKKIIQILSKLNIEELVLLTDEIAKLQREKLQPVNSLGNSIIENHKLICDCGNDKIWKNGLDNHGKQNYICSKCKKSIRATNETIYDSTRKHLLTWNQYINLLLNNLPLAQIAAELRINYKTSFLWRHKIMATLSQFDYDIKLSGRIWIDEFQISTNYKGQSYSGPRMQRRHGNDKVENVNDETVIILLAIDDNDNMIVEYVQTGKILTQETANKYLLDRIEPESIIITDEANAYNQLVDILKLKRISYKSLDHSEETLLEQSPMNNLCSNLEEFLYRFHGVKTKYLQKYLDLFRFLKRLKYTTEDKKDKILSIFNQTINTRIKLKLRDLYKN